MRLPDLARGTLWTLALLVVQGQGCAGEACESDADCAPDGFCPFTVCLTGCASDCHAECRERATRGQPCILDLRPPEQSLACVDDLVCNAGAGGRCTPRQPLGGPCGNDLDCLGSDDTDGPSCSAPGGGSCVAAGSLAAGERCFAERACGPDLTCGDVCLPALDAGADCARAPGSCRDGLSCIAGRCEP